MFPLQAVLVGLILFWVLAGTTWDDDSTFAVLSRHPRSLKHTELTWFGLHTCFFLADYVKPEYAIFMGCAFVATAGTLVALGRAAYIELGCVWGGLACDFVCVVLVLRLALPSALLNATVRAAAQQSPD